MKHANLRFYDDHPLTYATGALVETAYWPHIPLGGRIFLRDLGPSAAAFVVVATVNRRLVGFFRGILEDSCLYAKGTWVHSAHRKQGLAKELWRRALRHEKPRQVEVGIISCGGLRLAQAMDLEYPEIEFAIQKYGAR